MPEDQVQAPGGGGRPLHHPREEHHDFRVKQKETALAEVGAVLAVPALNDRVPEEVKAMAREMWVLGMDAREISDRLKVPAKDVLQWRVQRLPGGIEDWDGLKAQRASALEMVRSVSGPETLARQETINKLLDELTERAYDAILNAQLFAETDIKKGDEIAWAKTEEGKRVRISGLKFPDVRSVMGAVKLAQQIQESQQEMAMEERKFMTDRGRIMTAIMSSIWHCVEWCEHCSEALRRFLSEGSDS
jgi:hypothetical protein